MKRQKGTATIYKYANGLIFHMKIVTTRAITDIPVSNSTEKTCRRAIREIFGNIDIVIVTVDLNGRDHKTVTKAEAEEATLRYIEGKC